MCEEKVDWVFEIKKISNYTRSRALPLSELVVAGSKLGLPTG